MTGEGNLTGSETSTTPPGRPPPSVCTTMLSSSSPTRPNYYRRAYGDGSQDKGTASGRDFLRRQQKWRLKKKQSNEHANVYVWHGRKITIVKKQGPTRGSGLSAIRSLSTKKVEPTPALSPLKIDVSEPPPTAEEPPSTESRSDEQVSVGCFVIFLPPPPSTASH